jgi:hypothetical protein
MLDLGNQEQPEVELLQHGAVQVISGTHYEQTVISFHKTNFSEHVDILKINAPNFDSPQLSESMLGYMSMAFPTLFPDGAGEL